MYEEAAMLPYALNTFFFDSELAIVKCLKALMPTQKCAMGKIIINPGRPRCWKRVGPAVWWGQEFEFIGKKLLCTRECHICGESLDLCSES